MVSGNTGHNKAYAGLLRLARAHSREASLKLVECVRDQEAPWAVRVVAANSILDRSFGRPKEHVDVGSDGPVIIITGVPRSDDQDVPESFVIDGLGFDPETQHEETVEPEPAAVSTPASTEVAVSTPAPAPAHGPVPSLASPAPHAPQQLKIEPDKNRGRPAGRYSWMR